MTAVSTAPAPASAPARAVSERLSAARLGLARGGIEIWQTLTYWPDLLQAVFFSAVSVVALVVMRGHQVPGTTFSLGSLTLPGVIGMNIAVGGVTGVTALLATIPLGILLGSLIADPRFVGAIVLPFAGLAAISGIFYPITHLPAWLQWLGQVFPMYWLGLGMRSALLPATMASVEIGHSWRHLATFGVLGAWAVIGLVLAPVLLRRMARRESGSVVAARREKAMARAT